MATETARLVSRKHNLLNHIAVIDKRFLGGSYGDFISIYLKSIFLLRERIQAINEKLSKIDT